MTRPSEPRAVGLPYGAIFVALAGLYLVAYFFRVSAAVIAGDLERDLLLSSSELGTLAAALFYAFAFVQLPLGPLLDRFGARRILMLCGALTVAGAVTFAISSGYEEALLGRILMGAGTASVLMGSLKIYSSCFPSHRFSTLVGWQIAIGNSGNLLATAPLAWLVSCWGWRLSFAAVALVTAGAVAMVGFTLRSLPATVAAPDETTYGEGWRVLVRDLRFWGMAFLAFFWYGSYMAVQGLWGGPYLDVCLGMSGVQGGKLLMLTAIGFIVGCPVSGVVTDRRWLSPRQLIVVGQVGMILVLTLFVAGLSGLSSPLLAITFFFYGLCVSTGPVLYTLVKQLYPSTMVATALTSVNFFVVLGAALLQQVMGGLLQGQGSAAEAYRQIFQLPLGGLLLATLFFVFIPLKEKVVKTGSNEV